MTNQLNQLIDLPAFHASKAAPHLSERYHFYSTRDLIEPLVNDGWEVTQAFQVRSRHYNPFGKHLVRLSHEKLRLGSERLEAVIQNSHDGRSKFEFMVGAWRMICSNGMIIGTEFAHAEIAHVRVFEHVQGKADLLIEHAPQVAQVFDAWKSRATSKDERYALAIAAATIRWGKKQAPVDPNNLLEVRREEDADDDLWTVFNRIQENVMTGGIARLNDRRRTRRIGSIDETVRINKALWRAAERLYAGAGELALPS